MDKSTYRKLKVPLAAVTAAAAKTKKYRCYYQHQSIDSLSLVCMIFTYVFINYSILEDTARNAGLHLAPAEGFGLRPRIFFASLGK